MIQKLLDEKNSEISELKSQVKKQEASDSSGTHSTYEDSQQIFILKTALREREEKILHLQEEIKIAMTEMEESTELIKALTSERNCDNLKVKDLSLLVKQLQKQNETAQQRIEDLEEKILISKTKYESKEKDVSCKYLIYLCIFY